MVYYFTASDGCTIYMGKDKHENEHLIKYGWPEDVWFHVDDLSSAHVYLRLPGIGTTWDSLTDEALEDCAQLVKANSIQGSKKSSVKVVYTPWPNLLKTKDMADGQVGYKNTRQVAYHTVEKRDKEILKRLAKTKREADPDLSKERAARDREEIEKRKKEQKRKIEEEKKQALEREREKELKSYKTLFESGGAAAGFDDFLGGDKPQPTLDQTAAAEWEDDFM